MGIAFVFLPLAFNGPCISENGPKVMEFILKKNNYIGDYFKFELAWDESPKQYMERVLIKLFELEKKYSKIIVFGGNHLSLIPIYNLTEVLGYNSITLDAHRDYLYNNGAITHASFLRLVNKEKSKRYILGFRDKINEKDAYNFFDKEVPVDEINNNLNLEDIKYVDIDIDVLDESVFPYTACKKPDGLSLDQLIKLLNNVNLSEVKILSLTEYAYILDDNKDGIKIMLKIVDEFI